MKKWIKIIILISIIFVLIIACVGTLLYYYFYIGNVTVHLYVSNQSFADPSVNLTVTIDGVEKFSKQCWVDDQHNWSHIEFELSKGKHTIEVNENDHNIINERKFSVHDDLWIVVDYWYYPESHYNPTPRHISIDFHDEQVFFL